MPETQEISDYQSAYEGEQIDQAIALVRGIRTGSVTIVPAFDGDGYASFDIGAGASDARIFASACCPAQNLSRIGATVKYNAQTGSAVGYIWGDDVIEGYTYRLDWLMVPAT